MRGAPCGGHRADACRGLTLAPDPVDWLSQRDREPTPRSRTFNWPPAECAQWQFAALPEPIPLRSTDGLGPRAALMTCPGIPGQEPES